MNICVLYDNTALKPGLASGWGFSVLVGQGTLFDTGENGESLLHNMQQLDRDINNIERLVISHNHWDHIGGLEELLAQRYGLEVYIGETMGKDLENTIITHGGKVVYTKPGMKITDNIYTTGAIPASYKEQPMPEQALIIRTSQGTGIITGCSHPQVPLIVESAKALFPEDNISLLLGGFHWRDFSAIEAEKAAEDLQRFSIATIVPTHCSGQPAVDALNKVHRGSVMTAGAGFELTL